MRSFRFTNRGRTRAAVLVILSVLMGSIATVGPASAAEPPAPVNTMIQACKGGSIVLIAARGSGESANADYGLGPTMWSAYRSMYDEIKNHGFNGQELRVVPVIYDAQPVWSLPFVVQGQNAFFRSIAVGVQYTRSLLDDYRSRPECSGKPLILAGYSQGAMIMHRILRDGNALRDVNVWSPLLVADGDRVAYDNLTRWGGADPGKQGVGLYFSAISGSSNVKSDNPGFIRDVCLLQDAVCSPEIGGNPWWCQGACIPAWQLGVLLGEIWVHQQYANSTALDQAARAIPR